MVQRRRSRLSILAIPILTGLLAAACGGDDDNAATGTTERTTSTTEEVTTTTSEDSTVSTVGSETTTTLGATGTTLSGGPTTTAGTSRTTTTVRRATTTVQGRTTTTRRSTATTVDQGPPKNIVGAELAAGAPIRLGVLGANANPNGGNVQRMYEIAFDVMRKNGRIPINGRDVVLYWRGWDFADVANAATNARAACVASAQDDKVFAAIQYASSGECLASDFKIPVVASGMTDEAMDRSFPYVFALGGSANDAMANEPLWAEELGLLKGRKLGLLHSTAPGRQQRIDKFFKPYLKRAGYTLAEDIGTADDAGDRVAVQRFKAAGVDTLFMMGPRTGDFGKTARAQGFKPKYILGNIDAPVICGGCPARVGMPGEIFDGSYAQGGGRFVEDGQNGNPPPNQVGQDCAATYEKYSGERVRQTGTAEEQQRYQSVAWSCIESEIIVRGLQAAGPKLTQGALINALETNVKNVPSGFFADITFSRTNHFGANAFRTLILQGDCLCWKAVGGLRPYLVDTRA